MASFLHYNSRTRAKGGFMKLAVSAQDQQLSSSVDPRFGRAQYFLVVDTDSGNWQAVDNQQNLNAPQGAGVQAGKNVTELGVDAVITGHVGPKAFTALTAGGVAVYTGATGTVAEAVEQLKAGQLHRSSKADVEGHWV
jgi:predicted Fe-Mo cluster-binding NifX family protein